MIKEILKENKLKISLIYSLLIIQYVLFSIMPYLLGKAIDGLLIKDNFPLILLLITEITALILGYGLKRIDTIVFMKIFCDKEMSNADFAKMLK